MKVRNILDLVGYEIRNAKEHLIAGDKSSPTDGDHWLDTVANRLKYRVNGATKQVRWTDDPVTASDIATGAVGSDELADNAVDTNAVQGGAITQAKLANDSVGSAQIIAGNVDTSELADNAVTAAKINSALKPSGSAAAGTEALRALGTTASTAAAGNDPRLSDSRNPTGAASGSLTGTYPSPGLATDSVGSAQIAANAVGSSELADNAVDTDAIQGSAVTETKLAADSVGTAALKGGAVTEAKMATNSVGTSAIKTEAVTEAKLGAEAVNTAAIKNGAVTPAKLSFDPATQAEMEAAVASLNAALSSLTGENPWKDTVRTVATAHVSPLFDGLTINGVLLAEGDRVLLTAQSSGADNGIWIAGPSPVRADDANTWDDLEGAWVAVEEGTFAGRTFRMTSVNGTLGTSAVNWVEMPGLADLVAGAALTKTGNTLDVAVDNSTVEVNADALRVKADGITASHIAANAVGASELADNAVDAAAMADASVELHTATVTGTLPIGKGGTGATAPSAARTALQATGKYVATLTGNGATTEFTVAHGIDAMDYPLVTVWDKLANEVVLVDIVRIDSSQIKIVFGTAPPTGTNHEVVVVG